MPGCSFSRIGHVLKPNCDLIKKWNSTSFVACQIQGGKTVTELIVIQCCAAIINHWFSCQLLQMPICRQKGTSPPILSHPPNLFFCNFPDLETYCFLVHTYSHFSSPPRVLFSTCTGSKMAQTVECAPPQRKC